MDEDNLNSLIQRCSELKYKFRGVYAADNFPTNLTDNSFIIVNISTSASIGTHWILLCQRDQKIIFADPLGQTLSSYKHLQSRIVSNFNVNTYMNYWETNLYRNKPQFCVAYFVFILLILFSVDKNL